MAFICEQFHGRCTGSQSVTVLKLLPYLPGANELTMQIEPPDDVVVNEEISVSLEVPELTMNTLRPGRNCDHFTDNIFHFFLNENVQMLNKISLKFVISVKLLISHHWFR